MIKKPEKKEVETPEPICDTHSEIARYGQRWERGYNQACDEYEAYLKENYIHKDKLPPMPELRPLGTTGDYVDTMGNRYKREGR